MASGVDSVVELSMRARELYDEKRLFSRAADKYGAAAAAAAVLQPGDNAVVASLQARQAVSLLTAGYDFFNTAAALEAARTEVPTLLRAAICVVQRRKAAGTLRAGACTAFEKAFETARSLACYKLAPAGAAGASTAQKKASAAQYADHVGYCSFMAVGAAAVSFFANALPNEDASFRATNAALIAELCAFVTAALDEIRTVKLPPGMVLPPERDLVRLLRMCIENDGSFRDESAASRSMLRAWSALTRSGVLVARGIDVAAAADASLMRGSQVIQITADLRRCALTACGTMELRRSQFKKCGACELVVYCCKEHQTQDWPSHKAACKASRNKAAAAATDTSDA